jgi:hypothetical protein
MNPLHFNPLALKNKKGSHEGGSGLKPGSSWLFLFGVNLGFFDQDAVAGFAGGRRVGALAPFDFEHGFGGCHD